jgi:hypothetical protein
MKHSSQKIKFELKFGKLFLQKKKKKKKKHGICDSSLSKVCGNFAWWMDGWVYGWMDGWIHRRRMVSAHMSI